MINNVEIENFEKTEKKETVFPKKECCVCINVYAQCDKNHYSKDNKKFCKPEEIKNECCVCINIYTECED